MALTQSARLPGPMWDEEVVPALRKRLESESRTLARRISAISMSSGDEANSPTYNEWSSRQKQGESSSSSANQSYISGGRKSESSQRRTPDHTTSGTSPRSNGDSPKTSKLVSTPTYQRTRTYSSPNNSDFAKIQPNGTSRSKVINTQPDTPRPSLPRTSTDVKPTRIPKVARPPTSGSSASSPYVNGYSNHGTAVTPSHSPEIPYRPSLDRHYPRSPSNIPSSLPASSSRSTLDLPRGSSNRNVSAGLLNEAPPFPTDATMSSGFSQQVKAQERSLEQEDPPRPSIDSEERPFEHWYRGEVSRNGGVGELRVGRRKEMLDIANYGHLIGKQKPATSRNSPRRGPYVEDLSYRRTRADSIGGLTNKQRERESFYLDDENAAQIDHILNENPLTDLEGEGSDSQSVQTDQFDENDLAPSGAYAYVPNADDVHSISSSAEQWTASAGAHEARSTTPTAFMRPSSRQTQNMPPSRIPQPSSRRSSDSRSTVNTPSVSPMVRGASEPSQTLSYFSTPSKTPSPPPMAQSSTSPTPNQRSLGLNSPAQQKRKVSPAPKKARTPMKAKPKPTPKKDERRSVAHYPTVEGDELADAIPSWTQPVPMEGNWDEVVLPVVARKKGLDGHYENAVGSPKPKRRRSSEPVAPAPGTFGFDHTKYRQPGYNDEFIPLDEFPPPDDDRTRREKSEDESTTPTAVTLLPDGGVPIHIPPSPSPVPFAHYAPTSAKTVDQVHTQEIQQHQQEIQRLRDEEEKGAGCCKCVVM